MLRMNKTRLLHRTSLCWFVRNRSQHRPTVVISPYPGVAEPKRRQQMKRSCLWPTIADSNTYHDVKWVCFSIFKSNVEVAAFREDARVDQFIFRFLTTAIVIRFDKIFIGKGVLRVFVQSLHIRMSWGIVEKEIIFFDILPMVAFRIRQAEEPFLQNWIGLVPQGKSKTHESLIVTNTQQAILAPTIGARTRVIMWEVIPCITIDGIILTYSTPLAFTKIRSPAIPRLTILMRFLKSALFCVWHHVPSLLAYFVFHKEY